MSIKLALLDANEAYLGGLINFLNAKYPGEFEIHAFTNVSFAMNYVEGSDMELFIADENFKIDMSRIPSCCKFAYFTSTEEKDGAILKNQNADLIYKGILQAAKGNCEKAAEKKCQPKEADIIVFSSPCGGAGTSTLAAACAVNFARNGKKVLYLNLEKFGDSDLFFSSMQENYVKTDESGVNFCDSCETSKLALDEIVNNISEAKVSGVYDCIIADADFNFDSMQLYSMADMWVWVSDGSDIQNSKTVSAYEAFNGAAGNLCDKIYLVYNKLSENSRAVEKDDIKCMGAAAFVSAENSAAAVREMADFPVFDEMLKLFPTPFVEEVNEPSCECEEEPAEEVVCEPETEENVTEVEAEDVSEEETPCEEKVVNTRAYLIRISGNERIVVDKPMFTIGRGTDNDYVVADNKYIGHSHCHIVSNNGEYFAVDDNSKNHTFIDGKMLEAQKAVQIFDGQILKLANEEFRFILNLGE